MSRISEERAIELYAEFRRTLPQAPVLPYAPYPNPFANRTFDPFLGQVFVQVANDVLRELANFINEFGGYIRRLDAWRWVQRSLLEDDKLAVIVEHVRPLAVLCLNSPYAIRGRILHAVCSVSQHASHYYRPPYGPSTWSGTHANFKQAQKLADRWNAWPAVCEALKLMNGESFSSLTGEYRNNHHHGQPRGIAIGYTSEVKRVAMPNDQESWSVGMRQPLSVEDLVVPLGLEHGFALSAFRAFLGLLEEQIAAAQET